MSSVIIAILSAAVVLGVVILVHEWGHFIVGKLFGVRIVVFSFGYGPRLWGWKHGDTDYRISALPLGGYVRMAGDNPVEDRNGTPDEFMSKTRWQRVLIYLAGPTMNVMLAFLVFVGIFAIVGQPTPTYTDKAVDIPAIAPHSFAEKAGIQPGDRIVKIANVNNPTWEKAFEYLTKATAGAAVPIVVQRNGQQVSLTSTADPSDPSQTIGYPPVPPVISEVVAGYPAERAGMQPNDEVVSINGQPVATWPVFIDLVKGSDGKPLHIIVKRNGQPAIVDVTPIQGNNEVGQTVWQIGAGPVDPLMYEREGIVPAVKQAGAAAIGGVGQVLNVVGELITGKVSVKQLQSVVGIARMSGQAAKRGLIDFLEWIAMISINLGVLNLLPIPILDGGNIVMLAIEGVLRRDMSLAVKERIVQVGLVFLLVIFVIVMYNDVARSLPHH
jgi:regulator of sigma E protease